ncbi:hypothetical protein L1049_023233 [Liquidambar formosana]|uniref:RNase H type-1 domain-containing protein n=1 Tax=Liquidambar formosana TaxID=63359 RepID=A0AAP0REI9_LIQFO
MDSSRTGLAQLKVSVAVDSAVGLTSCTRDAEKHSPHAPLTDACKRLMRREWDCVMELIYREGNAAADYLAGLSPGLPSGLTVHLRGFSVSL